MWFAVTWKGLEIAIVTEINQTEKDKHHIILFICERKKYKLTYLQNISKECKNKLTVTRVYGEEGGIGSLGLTYTDYNV